MKLFLIIFYFCLFVGCEGFVEYSGIIYDAATKAPLDSVKCTMVAFSNRDYCTVYSDSAGNYFVSTPMVGCVPDCGEYEVKFYKQGYKTQVVDAPSDVYLEKE